jgi:hypothetical protein
MKLRMLAAVTRLVSVVMKRDIETSASDTASFLVMLIPG